VLADIAADHGYDRATFLTAMESEAMRTATRADFAATQSLGVSGLSHRRRIPREKSFISDVGIRDPRRAGIPPARDRASLEVALFSLQP
jgi:hypothetical protein